MIESHTPEILLQRIKELEKEISFLKERPEPASPTGFNPDSLTQSFGDASFLLETAPVAVMLHDLKGNYLYANRRTLE